MGRRDVWCIALVGSVVASGAAQAHSVSVSRGTVLVERDVLRAEICIPIDDLLHYFRPAFDEEERLSADVLDDCVRGYELQVLRHFVIRDGQGQRINGRTTLTMHSLTEAEDFDYSTLRAGWANYRLEYELAEPPRFLTLQQTFFSDGRSHAAQLVVDVRTQADQPGCIVQLTNRGNAETVQVYWDEIRVVPLRVEAPAKFRAVSGQLSVDPDRVRLLVAMPLALLETWSPISRSDPDFVTNEEWSAAKGRLADLLASGVTVQVDGRPISAAVSSIELLEPQHEGGRRRQDLERWLSWAARVGATLEFATDSAPRDVLLDWRLFNAAVLEAEITCVDGDQMTTHRLTPYEATLRWEARERDGGGG